MKKQILQRALALLILAAFVVLVEYWLGWRTLLAPWREQSPAAIALACAATLLTYWLRTLRLHDYFREELRGRFKDSLAITLTHNMLNNLLPMRTGEISFPLLMHRRFGMNPVRSTAALLWFRVLDLHTLGLIALLAVGLHAWGPLPTLPLAALWLALIPAAQTANGRLRGRFDPDSESRLVRLAAGIVTGLPRDRRAFQRAWAWTLVNWLVKIAVFAWVLTLFVEAPTAAAWLAVIGGDLTSVLPVHGVAGAGTYEAGVVAGLLPFGVDPRAALAAAVNLHLFVLGTAIGGGGVGLLLRGR